MRPDGVRVCFNVLEAGKYLMIIENNMIKKPKVTKNFFNLSNNLCILPPLFNLLLMLSENIIFAKV